MYFREVKRKSGDVVQCIRLTYDATERKNAQKVVGTFSAYLDTVRRDELPDLTDDEYAQAQAWLQPRAEARQVRRVQWRSESLPGEIQRVVLSLTEGPSGHRVAAAQGIDPAAMWGALDDLTRALKRAGIEKPKPAQVDEAAQLRKQLAEERAKAEALQQELAQVQQPAPIAEPEAPAKPPRRPRKGTKATPAPKPRPQPRKSKDEIWSASDITKAKE